MNIKPTLIQNLNNKKPSDYLFGSSIKKNLFEISDNILTVKENDEFSIICIVERSKPAAQIVFLIGDTTDQVTSFTSLLTSNVNIIKNDDKTYKTIYTASLKSHSNDHGKLFACRAENGMSNQKWENRRSFNIMCKYKNILFLVF